VRIVIGGEPDSSLVLERPPRPGLVLAVYTGLEEVAGREFRVVADGGVNDGHTAAAARCDASGRCTAATGGEIRIERLEDSTLVGIYTLTFADSGRVQGRFRARWVAVRMLCG
jgi:hypothetical protein